MPESLEKLEISYITLLKLPISKRIYVQSELIALRDHIAYLTGEDIEEVQNKFEALVEKKETKGDTKMANILKIVTTPTVVEAIILGAVIIAFSIILYAILTS